ncbi:MAG: ZIP family metal transporter [Bacteroidales bacterium]|nr:ZIP family metal transporter [Bacteroidales bacterium]
MIWTYVLLVVTVLLSGAVVFLFKHDNTRVLKLLLAFSGAFLIGITFLNLIPEVYEDHIEYIGLFILLGFLLQLLLELLTRGAEHGHEHDCENCHKEDHISPVLLMVGLCTHAFLEGMPIVPSFDPETRNILVTGIIIHNIPISLALVTLFLHYGMTKGRAVGLLLIFALMTPLGSLVSQFIQAATLQDISHYFNYAMALVIGIFLHVSTSILFETEENHQYNFRKFLTVILGLAVAFAITYFGHAH